LLDEQFSMDSIKNMDEFTAITIARHLALYEQNQTKLEGFLYQVQSEFDALPDELNLWMGILNYKLGNLDKAKTLL
ncbi:putative transcriptional regulator, partial [Vibrio harveyi]